MDIEKIIKILHNEELCVKIASINNCNRECKKCPLVMDSKDIIEAYEKTIELLINLQEIDIN